MNATAPPRGAPESLSRAWSTVLRWTAVFTASGAAAIHASVVDEHYGEWAVEGLFFAALATAQALLALAVATRPRTAVYAIAISLSLAAVALWIVSRTAGVPIGPHAWVPEPVGRPDAVATVLELTTATALAPLVVSAPGRAGTWLAIALVGVATVGATEFALVARHGGDAHTHGAGGPASVPSAGPTGQFSLEDARRARRCARRLAREDGAAPATRVTLIARHLCFDASTITLAASRRVVVRLDNRERSHSPSRVHTFSIYAVSAIPARHRPVVIGEPVRPGARLDARFRAPPPGSYFFQCDIHRFMRGIVVFE
jgi:hypothetical protein